MSTITHVSSLSDLSRSLEKSKGKLTVIDFHASWCGPCHQIAPKYETLSREYTSVNFTKCDVDAAQDVAQKYSITAMPSFVFIKDGQKVDLVRGADPRGLENTIKKHSSGTASSTFSGAGQTLGGSTTTTTKSVTATSQSASPFEAWSKMDPQVQILGLLVGCYVAYLLFLA